ncbi:hypothetical protein [Streptomyces sp. YS-3]|uniref:hypothetical protein n=1 Tax=Streptomyces sp. YS-3 TaxID=3381352 RepID=UPI003862C422
MSVSMASCTTPGYISEIDWDGSPRDFAKTDDAGVVSFSVPADATPKSHDVQAWCIDANRQASYGTAPFVVTAPADAEITLDPTEGASGTSVTVSGSQFNCSYVDLKWDDTPLPGADVTSDGAFTAQFAVPADATATTHHVYATCTDYPDRKATADFTVTEPATNGTTTGNATGSSDGNSTGNDTGTTGPTGNDTGTTGPTGNDTGTTGTTGKNTSATGSTDGSTGGTDQGSNAIPTAWVVGPTLFGAVLLLAVLFSLLNHRQRGPRWAHDHIRAALRPGAGTVALQEERDPGSADRTVRLEPHTDPGDQRLY